MKRTKSTISLKNLAQSLKNSINFDNRKSNQKAFIPLKSSSSTINLHQNRPYSVLKQSAWNSKQECLKMTKKQVQQNQLTRQTIISKLSIKQKNTQNIRILQEHKQKLEYELQSLQKISMKSYQKQLTQLDNVLLQLKQINKKRKQIQEKISQLKNQELMHNEEILSWSAHFEQSVAQRQYCEQFIQRYQEQYKEQSQIVLTMLKLQIKNMELSKRQLECEDQIKSIENQYRDWKCEQEYDLKQKKFSNKLKLLRIQLMAIQQKADDLMNENEHKNSQRKIREQICSFFKKYNQKNINYISQTEIADGIQIFICKEGLISQFQQFLKSKSKQICKKSLKFDNVLKQYCQCLYKIQQFFTEKSSQVNKKISNMFNDKIIKLKEQLENTNQEKDKNNKQIILQKEKIQKVLANQSITIIQVLQNKQTKYKNQDLKRTASKKMQGSSKKLNVNSELTSNTNKGSGFNIGQIKTQIKKLKLQQALRINSMRETFFQLKSLQKRNLSQCLPDQNKLQSLLEQIHKQQNSLQQILQIQQGFNQRRDKYDSIINSAIKKMKQADLKKQEIQNVSIEIQKLKKQKIANLTKNFKQNKLIREKQNLWQFPENQQDQIKFDFTRKLSYRQNPSIFPEYGFTKSKKLYLQKDSQRQSQYLKQNTLKLTKSNSMKSSQFNTRQKENKKNQMHNRILQSSRKNIAETDNNHCLKLTNSKDRNNSKILLSQMLISKLTR